MCYYYTPQIDHYFMKHPSVVEWQSIMLTFPLASRTLFSLLLWGKMLVNQRLKDTPVKANSPMWAKDYTHTNLSHTHTECSAQPVSINTNSRRNRTLTRPQTQICRGAHRSRRALLVSEPLLWTAARSPHTEHRQRERERERGRERERTQEHTSAKSSDPPVRQ